MANAKRGTIGPVIRRYFEEHPGVDINASELVETLMMTPEQISASISKLRSNGVDIVAVGRGTYRYVPNKKPSESLFRLVGTSKSGALIIERDDGRLYKATELE